MGPCLLGAVLLEPLVRMKLGQSGQSGEEAAHLITARKQRDTQGPDTSYVLQKIPHVAYFFQPGYALSWSIQL